MRPTTLVSIANLRRVAAAVLLLWAPQVLGTTADAAPAAAQARTDSGATQSKTYESPATPGGRLRRAASAIFSDFGYVLSSPARLNRRGLLWTTGVAAATGVLYGYDGEIRDAFHRSRGSEPYATALDLGERTERLGFMGATAPYWLGAAALGTALERYRPFREVQSISLDVLESHAITGTIRNSAKVLIGRQRPYEAGRSSFFKHGTSTPSGHASVAFEVATILTRHTHGAPLGVRVPVGIATYGVATAICVQRIDSDGHWPSDVFMGAVSGALIADTVARRNEERRAGGTSAEASSGATIGLWLAPSGAIGIQAARAF